MLATSASSTQDFMHKLTQIQAQNLDKSTRSFKKIAPKYQKMLSIASSHDWSGTNYCSLHLDWNYAAGQVDISMPDYVTKALHKFQHQPPTRPSHAPHRWDVPAYGKLVQYAQQDVLPYILDCPILKCHVQAVVGTFLYYARAVDYPLLPSLNEIATQQSKPTQTTVDAVQCLLDFAHTYPNAKVRFYASDMILNVDTDAAYLVLPNAKSRVGAFYYLGTDTTAGKPPCLNGAILVEC
jgi:hypothetical protein